MTPVAGHVSGDLTLFEFYLVEIVLQQVVNRRHVGVLGIGNHQVVDAGNSVNTGLATVGRVEHAPIGEFINAVVRRGKFRTPKRTDHLVPVELLCPDFVAEVILESGHDVPHTIC